MKKLILLVLFITSSFCFVKAQVEQNDSIKSDAEKKEYIDPIYDFPYKERESNK